MTKFLIDLIRWLAIMAISCALFLAVYRSCGGALSTRQSIPMGSRIYVSSHHEGELLTGWQVLSEELDGFDTWANVLNKKYIFEFSVDSLFGRCIRTSSDGFILVEIEGAPVGELHVFDADVCGEAVLGEAK